MLKIVSFLFFFVLAASTHSIFAQSSTSSAPSVWGDPDGLTGRDCETTMAILDYVRIADRETATSDQPIIVIARFGTGESSRKLIRLRIKQVADYLNRSVPRERIITAEGESIRGLGQLEFYVGGKLRYVIKIKRNRDLVKGCDGVNK